MGIYRLSNRVVSAIRNVDYRMRLLSSSPDAVACAVLSAKRPDAKNPLRTSDTTTAAALRRRCGWVLAFALILFAFVPLSISAAPKNRSAMQVPGYRAVRVRYGPMNKMIMSVCINGQPANLLVDTGSNQLILDAEAAELFGVTPSPRGLLYIRSTKIQGQTLPVAFVQNMSAGGMNFGTSLVTLRRSSHADAASAAFDGVLGLDSLFRHKALINCRTKLVFFNVDQARRINLGSVAASEKFTRVPIQREETGALTVPCSIRGQPARLSRCCTKVLLNRSDSRRNRPGFLRSSAPVRPNGSMRQGSTISTSAPSKCRRKNLASLHCLSSHCNKAAAKSPGFSAWTPSTPVTPSSISMGWVCF